MLEYCHEIAGITFKTRLNINIPRINEKPFEPYISRTGKESEVIHNIVKLANHTTRQKDNLKMHQNIKMLEIDEFVRFFNFSSNTLLILLDKDEIIYNNSFQKSDHFIAANLRIIYSSFLTSFFSIMIHCSGLVLKNGAAIFLAPDFGGKTTLVTLANSRFPILNDDQVIIKKEDGIIFAHATPFGALSSGPNKAKLNGIYFLKKSNTFKIEPLSPLDLIECIWNEHLRYTHFLPVMNKKIAFEILYDALHQAPTYNLFFQKDYIDWDAVEKTMRK